MIIEQAPPVVASAFNSVISVATPERTVGPLAVIHTTLISRSPNATARLTIDFWPSPAHVGNRPTMIVREVGGVGVTAARHLAVIESAAAPSPRAYNPADASLSMPQRVPHGGVPRCSPLDCPSC